MKTIQKMPLRELLSHLRRIQQQMPMFLHEVGQKYGDIVLLGEGKFSAYFLNHPEAIAHVLQENYQNYTKNTIQYNQLRKITGYGLLTNDGESWQRNRRLIQPAFSRNKLMALVPLIEEVILPVIQRWSVAADGGKLINVDQEMMELALQIVNRFLFGMEEQTEAGKMTNAVITALDHLVERVRHPWMPPDLFPTPSNFRNRRALKSLDEICLRIIRSAETAPPSEENLLTVLLQARQDAGLNFGDTQVRDEVITLLIAGHETVASALTWTWYLLSQNPQYYPRLREEIRIVQGGRPPVPEDFSNLLLIGQVFDEALRLYPPAWLLSRRSIASDNIMGHVIPANALVIISPYAIHRHPAFWERPEAFYAERFAPDAPVKPHRYAYIPFGGGPRLCIGFQFALFEARTILAHLLARFQLSLPQDAVVHVDPLVTLRPRGGLWMRVEHAGL